MSTIVTRCRLCQEKSGLEAFVDNPTGKRHNAGVGFSSIEYLGEISVVPQIDEIRLMTKVARMYYEQGLRQVEIVDRLGLSQTTISRLLKRARQEQVVRITVVTPPGVHTLLEDTLQKIYGLKDTVVVDSPDPHDEGQLLRDIGRAAAFYVESTLSKGAVVGISSWSRALLAMMHEMRPTLHPTRAQVVQILGGIGDPAADVHASQLTRQFAAAVRGTPHFLPAPGAVRQAENRRFFLNDKFVRTSIELFPRVTVALVGIGALAPTREESSSGVVFTGEELMLPRKRGAVGDICLRFFDSKGKPVVTSLNNWVIGIKLDQLKQVKRAIGVAGGARKIPAILGALRGGWINGLITDRFTAERLVGGR